VSKSLETKDVLTDKFILRVKECALEIYLARKLDARNEKTFLAECYAQAVLSVLNKNNIKLVKAE
jgi:hypothetical protein